MSKVTVAAVQMTYGLETAVQKVERRGGAGRADHLLPELFEHWYFCQEKNYENYHLATTLEENPAVEELRRVARDFRVVLPVSYYERVGNTTFNTVAIIDADGSVLGQYRKTHVRMTISIRKSSISRPATPASACGTPRTQNRRGHLLGPVVPGVRAVHGADGRGTAVLPDRDRLRADPGLRFHAALAALHAGARGGEHHAALIAANRIGTETVTPSPDNQNQSSSLTFYGSSFIADETRRAGRTGRPRKRVHPDAHV